MAKKQYLVSLTESEREALEQITRSVRRTPREKKRARILLLCDLNRSAEAGGPLSDKRIAEQVQVSTVTTAQVRRRAGERGVLAAVTHKEQLHRKPRALDGAGEAILIATTCSEPPLGQSRWTLKLLRERLIQLEVVEDIGTETIRTTLKKTNSSPG